MKSERFQGLLADVEAIYAAHQDAIDALPTVSPRGGVNGRTVPGWAQSPCSAVSKAVRKLGLPYMKWWTGSRPTPSTAVPACIAEELEAAYNRRYAKEDPRGGCIYAPYSEYKDVCIDCVNDGEY